MKIIQKDIMTVDEGIIVHQVNCMDKIGAGLSGQIIKKYPIVEWNYHRTFAHHDAESIYKTWMPIQVTNELTVVNCFTQYYYGNARKTGKKYTDEDALVKALEEICAKYPDREIWIPYGIGCGLAGANWNDLAPRIDNLPLLVAKI